MRKLVILFTVATTVILISTQCTDDESKTLRRDLLGYDHYPIALDNEWIYSVDSTLVLFSGGKIESRQGFLRERIVDQYTIAGQGDVFVLEIAHASAQQGPYTVTDNWILNPQEDYIERVEENLAFAKYKLPIVEGVTWDPTLFLAPDSTLVNVNGDQIQKFRNWEAKIVRLHSEFTLNGVSYSDVYEIQYANSTDQVIRRVSKEYYAIHFGLIMKQEEIFDIYNSELIDPNVPWLDKAQAGYSMRLNLIEFNPG